MEQGKVYVCISFQHGLPPMWVSPSNVGIYMAFVIVDDVDVGGHQLGWFTQANMGGQ